MKILIVEPFITGHHLEYLNHLSMISTKIPNCQMVFVLPGSFEKAKSLLDWPSNSCVLFDCSLPTVENRNPKPSIFESFRRSIEYSNRLSHYIEKYSPDHVFSIDIMTLVPFFPIINKKNVSVSGIVYDIYLRNNNQRIRSVIASKLRFFILSKFRKFQSVFILNDEMSASKLNELYHTSKFKFLPDPFMLIGEGKTDFREDYNISKNKIVFAHFGALTERKGTLDILEAITKLPAEYRNKYVFVLAGRVNPLIKQRFYNYVKQIDNDELLIINDCFCSFEYLASLCKASNAILMPYHDTSKSSGLIGYASQFATPVIAYRGGLLQELIEKFKLGYLVQSKEDLCEAFHKISENKVSPPCQMYCDENNVDTFLNTIISNM